MNQVLFPLNRVIRAGGRPRARIYVANRLIMSCKRLDEASAKSLINNADSFLFDCDGVLWDGRGVILGSLETIQRLKALNKKVFYITNNSSKSRNEYLQKCKGYGFPATEEEIVCTSYIAALFLHNLNFKDKVYVVGNPAMATELDKFGIRHIGIGPDPVEGNVDDWINIQLDPEVKAVLVGFDKDISYMKIMRAASYLQRPECLFIGTNEDSHLPVKDSHIRVPGTGTMVFAVSIPSQRKPIILGKPERSMFEELRKAHNLIPDRCVMVGDRINTDIGLAATCGLRSLLVLSGVTTEQDIPTLEATQNGEGNSVSNVDKPIIPDFYASCLGDFGKLI